MLAVIQQAQAPERIISVEQNRLDKSSQDSYEDAKEETPPGLVRSQKVIALPLDAEVNRAVKERNPFHKGRNEIREQSRQHKVPALQDKK
jgi:hypothetical protein